jgi:pathogenesis-related protein 1
MLLLLLACSSAGTEDTASDGPALDPFAQAFVDAHNDARSRAEPVPDPALPDMEWDDGLAEVAAAWAAGCVFEHSVTQYGENLAAFSNSVEPAVVVDAWFSEIDFYDYENNSCQRGQQCGHYTQVVWRDTTRVGCAMQSCDLDGFGPAEYWVCNYDPPGNWVGEWPY